MGSKNIGDIMRRAELAQSGKGARQPDKPRGFREGLEQDYHAVLRGNEFMRRQPVHEERRISMDGQLALLAKIKEMKSQSDPKERTLLDFVKMLDSLGAFENNAWKAAEVKQSRRDTADFFIPNLSIGVLEGSVREELSGFFSERFRYGNQDDHGNWQYGIYTYVKIWPAERYSDTYKLHVRLPMMSEESMAAKVFLDSRRYGIKAEERGTLAGLIKLVHAAGWASKENTLELFVNRKTNRAVFCISELLGEETDFKLFQRVNSISGFFKERCGRGKEKAEAEGEKWWWAALDEEGKVRIGIKAPMIKDFGGKEGRKVFVHMSLSHFARDCIGPNEDLANAEKFMDSVRGQYVLKSDPRQRTVRGFFEMLRGMGMFGGGTLMSDGQLAKMEIRYDAASRTLAVKGECGSDYSMKEQGPYFSERFRSRRPTEEEREFRRENIYTYGLMEGGLVSDGEGRKAPSCFLKADSAYERTGDGLRSKSVFTLQLSGISQNEVDELRDYVAGMRSLPKNELSSSQAAAQAVTDFVSSLDKARELIPTLYLKMENGTVTLSGTAKISETRLIEEIRKNPLLLDRMDVQTSGTGRNFDSRVETERTFDIRVEKVSPREYALIRNAIAELGMPKIKTNVLGQEIYSRNWGL